MIATTQLPIASINISDDATPHRMLLTLAERDGRYVWVEPDGRINDDTDGATREEAEQRLLDAYRMPEWALRLEGEDYTRAQILAELLEDDGQRWETRDGQTLDALCRAAGAMLSYGQSEWDDEARAYRVREVSRGDIHSHTRYAFPDGSAIVAAGDGWDIEGAEPFSWAGA